MQHGTGREYVRDIVENVHAVLEGYARRGTPNGALFLDLRLALMNAYDALDGDTDLDEPGVFGPDYAQGLGVSAVSETTVGRIRPAVVETPDGLIFADEEEGRA